MLSMNYHCHICITCLSFFFFNDTATTDIYTLSLHDALPIYENHQDDQAERQQHGELDVAVRPLGHDPRVVPRRRVDRKSTRLNSSHLGISYAVFCLKKKKTKQERIQ